MISFRDKVLKIVAQIPRGQVLTYGQVAGKAGNPRAGRAVGRIMNANRSAKIPCHRVVGAKGWLGGFNSGVVKKKRLLKEEGALV
ncbi:MAG: 6-O-methylguanine DNA methyltransferase [Candidatus Yanofskybacteria bacterium CG10_big_fil_rev_8_21_14_0_10_46_23]|uniref:6-O-methylguanine DNA methyltransferase n=1 Tax=Candidatus Yanofskybacteria bacterium CG10_big_fil_rev_8_21_14_0_10_46_23 TaxID=1975098 RepID=A0A2H0R680_9BACT|nr:MAG: 6-O-methylguanine DNA methyltransferase [Candidatus Yanofskybacteria bacterium CG10_big_fil_rev_8_21_14_0_10_46_23]